MNLINHKNMKIEKNKIVFASVLLCIALFIVEYTSLVMGDDDVPTIENNEVQVPKLGEKGQKNYKSKLDALNDLKEVRQTNAPSIYDERLLDSTGLYDPDLLDKKKMKMVDSIYHDGRVQYSEITLREEPMSVLAENLNSNSDSVQFKPNKAKVNVSVKELGLEHQLFFASVPKPNDLSADHNKHAISVSVDGSQIVKVHSRLRMRLNEETIINDIKIPRNAIIYGFVSMGSNRVLIDIGNINLRPVKLKAFDLQDGAEGIYIENSFRAEASREVIGDVVQDVNIPGVPQVGGIKKIFQRNNRNVKVTILDNYQLLLKEDL